VFDWLTQFVSGASPWAYLAIAGIVALDAILPIVPGETAVITGAILAADGELSVVAVLLAAAGGAFAGDNVAYWAGALLGRRAVERIERGGQGRERVEWARRQIRERGGLGIVVARFLPGGRTATTLASGTLEMTWPRFAVADAIAAALWAAYATALGWFGGSAFKDSLWKPLGLAAVVAALVAGAGELYRRWRERSDRDEPEPRARQRRGRERATA
jgi:membrane protein DedA with SNARE-associated domain